MSEYKEQLVDAVIEMIKQDLPHDWSCLYDLLYYNVDENTLKEYLPEEEEVGERRAALQHWENCFRNGTVDDDHAEFIAEVLTKAKEELES